jgi:chemotaxis protein CheX
MKSLNELMIRDGAPEGWQPLLELAVREVFEIMLGCKLDAPNGQPAENFEFTAMVGLAGQLCGVLTLRCSAASAVLMTTKMLGGDAKEDDPAVWDALGEVANMIAGNFKNKLTGMGDTCMLSVPTVITGADYTYHSLADAGPLEILLLFEGMPVTVSLEIHS